MGGVIMKDKTLGLFSHTAPAGLCNKKEYPNKKSAKVSAKRQRHKFKLRAYICDRCGFYHLTSADSNDREFFRLSRVLDRIEE